MSYVPPHLRKKLSESEKKEKEVEAVQEMNEKNFPSLGGGGKASGATKWSSNNVVAWSEEADTKRREEEYRRSLREERIRKEALEEERIRNSLPNFNRKPIFTDSFAFKSTTETITKRVSEEDEWSEVKKPVRKIKAFVDRPPEEEFPEEDEHYDDEDY